MREKDRVLDPIAAVNAVSLVGRVSAAPESRELPSGAVLVTFRLIVPRPPEGRGAASATVERRRVDVVDIACWSARSRRSAQRLEADVVVRVDGALRRRFFRTGGGAASRYEVEATSVQRVRTSQRRATPEEGALSLTSPQRR